MKKEYADLDDLDIMDLDVEEDVYTDIDANTDTNIDANTDTNSNINSDTEDTEDTWMEPMQEEPYVVLDASIGGKQENSEETIEEYDDAEEAFQDSKSQKDRKDGEKGFLAYFIDRLIHMETMDKIIAGLGCVVVILAIVALTFFMSHRTSENQLQAFADMGRELDNITLIGESGLIAVTDATVAKIDALKEAEEKEDEKEEEVEENVSSIVVKVNYTSIQKDLKVKFTNKRTGKLLAGIPFVLELESPSGKKLEWTDEDKDGIIYHKNIEGGTYKVTLKKLEGEIYERYIMDTSTQKATVKKEIVYEKVDVSDEILDESQVDASKEDTEFENTVESVLTDTVAWVASNKEPGGKDYVEVKKADIAAPAASTGILGQSRHYFMMMISQEEAVSITLDKATGEVEIGNTTQLTATVLGSEEIAVTWESSDTAVATVDETGLVTGVAEGNVTITATSKADPTKSAVCSVTVKAPVQVVEITLDKTSGEVEIGKTTELKATVTGNADTTVTWTSSDTSVATVNENGLVTGVAEGTATITATSKADQTKTATCSITVKPVAIVSSITLDKTTAEVEVGKEIAIGATVVPTEGVSVKWTSSNEEIATVNNGKVSGVKVGEATITAILVENGNETVKSTCSVTVKKATRKVTLDSTKLEMMVGEEETLKANVEGYTAESNGKVTWTTSDQTIATVDENGKVVALKAGSAIITAANTESDGKVEVACAVTVQEPVGLKTKDGAEVYVLKGDQYVKATAADYNKNDVKFYIYTDVYKYQGWQTIDGKTYYYTADNKKVTGEQVIMGAKYVFDNDGILTSTTGVMGIDVSKWNGTIDWTQVKASGVDYVIIRCGYRGSSKGALIEDPKYKANIEGATNAGLKVGVYFFSQAIDEVEAVQEASMVLSLVKNYKISYPIFLDVEPSGGRADNISKETRTAVCKAFCQTIQNSGYTAGVYANKTWLTNKIDTSQLGSYKIWLAQYAAAPTYTGRYEIWQYKDSGSVPGISGHVDLNLSYLGY